MNHIQRSTIEENEISFNQLANHLYVTGGADLPVSPSLTLSPFVLMKSDLNTYSFEGNITGHYRDKFLLGLSLRELDAFAVVAGTYLLPEQKLRLTYSFDYVLTARDVKETTSHEIMLSFRFPTIKFYEPSPIRSPRYRFE
jgi:hypothetical protein